MSFHLRKSLGQVGTASHQQKMIRTLGLGNLTFLGIGSILGAGVFILTGIAAAKYAGPAVSLSFAAAGMLCIFVGLAYGELASMIPAAGSAYAYTFTALGEGWAFLCGWSLLLAYTVTASAVAVGFSSYFAGLLVSFDTPLPTTLLSTPFEGGMINLPAFVIVLLLMLILIRGTKESSTLNTVLISFTLFAIVSFVIMSFPHTHMENLQPFRPFGWEGIASGAAVVFFSFMGFDTVATSAEECKNPERDLPVGIFISVLVCMILYMAVATTATALIPYPDLNRADPVAYALRTIGQNDLADFITIGILAGMVTTLLVYIYGQSRICFAIARDGLLPVGICKLHKQYKTPYLTTLIGSLIIALIAGFFPLMYIVELANTGTLAAFLLTFVTLLRMRQIYPNETRKFRFPLANIFAPIGILACAYMIYALSLITNLVYFGWMLFGLFIYYIYSVRHRRWNALSGADPLAHAAQDARQ